MPVIQNDRKETSEQTIERKFKLTGPGFLQFFASDGDDDHSGDDHDDDQTDDQGDDDDDDDDQSDDQSGTDHDDQDDVDDLEPGAIDNLIKAGKIDFDQLLKSNPALKKQYQARFNKNMSKRLSKYENVDIDEYNDLKKRAESGNLEGDAKTWKEKHDALKSEMLKTTQTQAIQTYAIGEKFDAEQIAFISSMINLKSLEQDDEGEWMGIDDEVDRIKEKFPRMFESHNGDDDSDDQGDDDKKKSKYNPGKKKHNHDSKKIDPKERGRLRALERHKKNQK